MNTQTDTIMGHGVDGAAKALRGGEPLCAEQLNLTVNEYRLRLRSNSKALIAELSDYFSHVPGDTLRPDVEVVAIEREIPNLGLEFIDWKREPGKTGRKDAYVELPGGRLVRKVRTGMTFLQSETHRIAAGPCRKYPNQLINFINSQFMNALQHQGWLICHASGLVLRDKGLGIAGFSGGGKSTLMLNLLNDEAVSYLTNDRLFIQRDADKTLARGIPKLPRINPGTIVHNPKLQSLIPEPRRTVLRQLPAQELWDLEEKFDVPVERIYGPDRIVTEAPLNAFLILNWRRDGERALEVERVDLTRRRELLGALMKSPGPFYQRPDGGFQDDTDAFDESAYLDALKNVAIYVATGRIDFPALTDRCLHMLLN